MGAGYLCDLSLSDSLDEVSRECLSYSWCSCNHLSLCEMIAPYVMPWGILAVLISQKGTEGRTQPFTFLSGIMISGSRFGNHKSLEQLRECKT